MEGEVKGDGGGVGDGLDFCTLGMFIIDEIHFAPPKPPVIDIIGGAGSYSAFGARVFSPPPASRSVGWIVDAGSDFPPEVRKIIARWETSCVVRETPRRLTTRGWNGYGEGEKRAFKYLAPKLRLDHRDLTRELALSRSFHLICSPTRCMELARDVPVKAESYLNAGERLGHRLLIWEPVPDLCTPAELENCFEAIRGVHVVSPNHDELAGFFGSSGVVAETGDVDLGLVEQWCRVLLDRGIGVDGKGAVVVRAGKSGCYTATREMSRWLPAFHQDPFKVVDPTGGGNAFLGGLAVGLVRTQSLEEAVIWGTVAASFAIEQVGMPELGSDARGETWNGARVRERLEQFRTRL